MTLLRNLFATLVACLAFCPQMLMAETVLLDFSSPGCGPCQQMRPTIRQLVADGHKVQEIDISREQHMADRWQVTQVPTFIVLVDGRETERLVGATSYQHLLRLLTASKRRPVGNSLVADRGHAPQTFAPTATANLSRTESADPFHSLASRPFPSRTSSPDLQRTLLEATVRLSVQDPQGTSSGTGTLIDSRQGEALVLTCGHIFRSSQGKGPIEVTLFQVGPGGVTERTTVVGKLQNFDLERDLALVSIRLEESVRAVPVAPIGTKLGPGDSVTSVGCNHGQLPTTRVSQVTATDRYQGPSNVEVAGAPVEGRSGGGLFNTAGQLVGVCFAADPQANEGLYASASSVQAKLKDLGLAMVFQSPTLGNPRAEEPIAPIQVAATPIAVAPHEPFQTLRGQGGPQSAVAGLPMELNDYPGTLGEGASDQKSLNNPAVLGRALNAVEQAALEEIQRRGIDSEVICIIRPHSPDGKSEVITLQNASPEFVRALTRPATAAAKRQLLR